MAKPPIATPEKPPAAAPAPEKAAAAEKPAKAAAAVEAQQPQRAVPTLTLARWSEASFKQARHAITPEAGTPYAELLNPAYYAHIAPRVNAGDVIEVRPADNAYYAEIYVWSKGANWLHVSELRKLEPPKTSILAGKAFSIDFVDGPAKHRVIRTADSQIMAQHFETTDAANAWLTQNASRIAA